MGDCQAWRFILWAKVKITPVKTKKPVSKQPLGGAADSLFHVGLNKKSGNRYVATHIGISL
ncbi:hypothetical protein GCM10028819_47900 [Spirosoma humi]